MHPDHLEAFRQRLAAVTSRRGTLALIGIGAAGAATAVFGRADALGKKRNRRRNRRQRRNRRAAQTQVNTLSGLDVSGEGNGKSFTGSVDVVRFKRDAGQLVAVGQLTGQVKDAAGRVIDEVSQPVDLPVELPALGAQVQTQQCDILLLDIPAVTIDVLGIPVVVGPFHIQITSEILDDATAELLCTLLAGGDISGMLTDLLNQILGMLGGLTPAA
jgi:hypothetical protein